MHVFVTRGLCDVAVSDNGPAFIAANFEQFLAKNSVKHVTNAHFHLRINVVVEKAVRSSKDAMRKQSNATKVNLCIARFLLTQHSIHHTIVAATSAELLMDRKLTVDLDCQRPDLIPRVRYQQCQNGDGRRIRSFVVNDSV